MTAPSAPGCPSADPPEGGLSRLESALGYTFEDPELLGLALRHRSYVVEAGRGPSNERLEFLGDAVLGQVVTEFIFVNYPDLAEGKMTKLRSSSVNRGTLRGVAEEVGLGGHLMLGKDEESSGGRRKASILADAMEAVLAAVYLDGGADAVRRLILERWGERIRRRAGAPGWSDYKSRLQEHLAQKGSRPSYSITEAGPDHEKRFTAVVSVEGAERGSGTGRSKREAEQSAARQALDELASAGDRG